MNLMNITSIMKVVGKMNKEIIIINDEPFYRIQNGTSYDYAPIPEQFKPYFKRLQQENSQLKDKLSKIETLIINHNCDTGDIYYKYNNRFLKSELKQRILEIVYEDESDDNE